MKILVKITKGKEANFDFTSGSNPEQTINRPETWERVPSQTDSSSALPSETELEEKKNIRGVKIHQLYMKSIDLSEISIIINHFVISRKGGNAKNGKDRDTLTYFTAREKENA